MRTQWFAVAIGCAVAMIASGVAAQTSGLTIELLRNSTYPSEFTPTRSAPLVDGRYAYNEGPARRGTVAFVTASIGPEYAVVVLGSNTGGTGDFITMHVVTSAAGVATAGPGLFLGDRWRVRAVTITGDRVRLDVIRHGPTEPLCCPTLADVREYVREGNRLRLVSSTQPDATPGAGPLPPRTGNAGHAGRASGVTAELAVLAAMLLALGAARASTRRRA